MLLLLLSLLLLLLSFMPDIVICTVSSPGMLATGGSFCSCLSCLVWSRDSPLLVCLFRARVYKVGKVSAAKGSLFDEL